MNDLDKIDARAKAATPGEWYAYDTYGWISHRGGGVFLPGLIAEVSDATHPSARKDADFIAASRTDVPALVAECRASRKVVEAAKQIHRFGATYGQENARLKALTAALAEYDEVVA